LISLAADPALLLIDVQEAFRMGQAEGYPWANPQAEAAIAALLAGFRAAGLPVLHVLHHGTDPADPHHPDHPGAQPMAVAQPLAAEPVIIKTGSSAFIGTDLGDRLAALGNPPLVVAGGAANYCVESTVRMAGNLGHRVTVAADALINYQKTLRDGRVMPPADVLAVVLATLDGEFAHVTDTADILSEISP
jgi:nicotinamidase-related amidase